MQCLPLESQLKKILTQRRHQHSRLSRREFQVFLCCVMGYTSSAMAKLFNISVKTVEYYLGEVKTKLDCESRADLFSKAVEIGYIALEWNGKTQENPGFDEE